MSGRVEVARVAPPVAAEGTPFSAVRAFADATGHIGFSRIGPGAETPWHHHGAQTFYGYLVEGELQLEFGTGGRDSVSVAPGDFLRIPPGTVHRDVNRGRTSALVLTVILGSGDSWFEVSPPSGGGSPRTDFGTRRAAAANRPAPGPSAREA